MINKIKRLLILLLSVVMIMTLFSGCGKKTSQESQRNEGKQSESEKQDEQESKEQSEQAAEHVKVQIEMEDGGTMIFELYPEYAPKTVANFVKLVNEGFYDGLTFHRIVKGFMIQGGDPNGDGTGGSDETIPGEFAANGFTQNTLSHTYGVISMARSKSYDSASSQFFIMNADYPKLDGKYAAFGKLIEGSETLDAISDTAVEKNDFGEVSKPVEPVVIKSIRVIE